ncbi:DUF4177 domain-containing protein [Candidatus Clostridium stratigraminis]|uniref:DUF4177 domain-containing protein n=1 Tax=Candidatus Clostridium stratigraminis TaxID=3381661 RepID=A0ABW8T5W3_9CLOT
MIEEGELIIYENKIVRINLKQRMLEMKPEQNYEDVINKYTQEGWRFIQVFAPPIFGSGAATFYDLIFEREI